ncbi:hypothetical protein E2C01_078985 [Portunus trituberculatus]|uniref:Uncharacterized protein n=1 Tax=Portunus trituberculatus TaxID=210409 RepID=A0A5B7IVL4_PORTR|nr:hypothetical protein [Portunus trituberculatus]
MVLKGVKNNREADGQDAEDLISLKLHHNTILSPSSPDSFNVRGEFGLRQPKSIYI